MTLKRVFELIDGERQYQDRHSPAQKQFGEYLTYMHRCYRAAEEIDTAFSTDSDDHLAAREEIRKIGAMAVAFLESRMDRKNVYRNTSDTEPEPFSFGEFLTMLRVTLRRADLIWYEACLNDATPDQLNREGDILMALIFRICLMILRRFDCPERKPPQPIHLVGDRQPLTKEDFG